ncbi:hypothetical protein F511_46842 [Dorcoceras hygrometricum]|uniref:Uncharacterized protein n=1 Tax=Dorcoceras hygrometricum TaxID=472368 RepID=A0A2Z6ZZ91_9LAMI|nr:hypothetical protein F511_46842 [Dorcoceras hygrometricum]
MLRRIALGDRPLHRTPVARLGRRTRRNRPLRRAPVARLGCRTRGDRALDVRGGLLGRDAGWQRWRMRCAAAGRPMCAERRFLCAAVRRAWHDVAQLPCEISCGAAARRRRSGEAPAMS